VQWRAALVELERWQCYLSDEALATAAYAL
jgi:hypothetical protein